VNATATEFSEVLTRCRQGDRDARRDLEQRLRPLLQDLLTRMRRTKETPCGLVSKTPASLMPQWATSWPAMPTSS
jgi:hypothetical protein